MHGAHLGGEFARLGGGEYNFVSLFICCSFGLF